MSSTSPPDSSAPPRPARWRSALGTCGALVLGGVLLVAAWSKLIDPQAFIAQVHLEGLDGLLPATAVAFIGLALEVGLGMALVLGLRRPWVLVPACLLVAFFLFLTGRNYWLVSHGLRSGDEGCGCFGNLVQRTPAEAFWQDLLLLVPPLLLAWLGRPRGTQPRTTWRLAAVAAVTAAALVLAWKAPELPLDDLATRLKPGVRVDQLCAGDGAQQVCLSLLLPELEAGSHVVVLAELEDPSFEAAIDQLNDYALDPAPPTLWVLTSDSAEQQRAFFWRWGPSFELHEVPAALLKPLYRRLPRSFVVEQGRVTRTFSGLAPLASLRPMTTAGGPVQHRDGPG